MAHVVGIPIKKGNNQEVISCIIAEADRVGITEGMAVGLISGGVGVSVGKIGAAQPFAGFIMDINPNTFTASLVRSADLVCLPSASAAALAAGDPVNVNIATGLIDATAVGAGNVLLQGIIEDSGPATAGVNGKTGVAIADCVLVSFNRYGTVIV